MLRVMLRKSSRSYYNLFQKLFPFLFGYQRRAFASKDLKGQPHVQGRNAGGARGAQSPGRRIPMGAPNYCDGRGMTAGRRKVPTMSQVLSSIKYFCFRKTSGSNMGRQTCFLPRAPSNLVTPLHTSIINKH